MADKKRERQRENKAKKDKQEDIPEGEIGPQEEKIEEALVEALGEGTLEFD